MINAKCRYFLILFVINISASISIAETARSYYFSVGFSPGYSWPQKKIETTPAWYENTFIDDSRIVYMIQFGGGYSSEHYKYGIFANWQTQNFQTENEYIEDEITCNLKQVHKIHKLFTDIDLLIARYGHVAIFVGGRAGLAYNFEDKIFTENSTRPTPEKINHIGILIGGQCIFEYEIGENITTSITAGYDYLPMQTRLLVDNLKNDKESSRYNYGVVYLSASINIHLL